MAYLRNTSGSFGIYEKYRDETGKQRERCLVRLGCYSNPQAAYVGYRSEIAHAWWTYRELRKCYGDIARHERWLATGVVDRLVPKLLDVVAYILSQDPDAKVHAPTWYLGEHWHPVAIRKLELEEQRT